MLTRELVAGNDVSFVMLSGGVYDCKFGLDGRLEKAEALISGMVT